MVYHNNNIVHMQQETGAFLDGRGQLWIQLLEFSSLKMSQTIVPGKYYATLITEKHAIKIDDTTFSFFFLFC